LDEIDIFFNQKTYGLGHDQNRRKENGVLNRLCQPLKTFGLREVPEVKSPLKIILSRLKIDCEILDDEWKCQVQSLSEKVPKQHINVFPLESSKHNLKQKIVSRLSSFHSIVPLLL